MAEETKVIDTIDEIFSADVNQTYFIFLLFFYFISYFVFYQYLKHKNNFTLHSQVSVLSSNGIGKSNDDDSGDKDLLEEYFILKQSIKTSFVINIF